MHASRRSHSRTLLVVAVLAGLLLITAQSVDARKAKHAGLSGKFVSFNAHSLVLEISANQLETFEVADKVPVQIIRRSGNEKSLSPGGFDGVPKGTRVEVTVDGSGEVSHVTILHPNLMKRQNTPA